MSTQSIADEDRFSLRSVAAGARCLARRRPSLTGARAETPPPQGVLSLSASASVEVTKDLLAVTFSTTREGTDANAVQAQLKQALDAALAEAKKAARPGQVDVQTGNFSLFPRYAPEQGRHHRLAGHAPRSSSKAATWRRSASSPAASRR